MLLKSKRGISRAGPTLACNSVQDWLLPHCSKCHQDNYVARALVSYNGCGTEMLRHENVNFWELENCGNNAHIVRDSSEVLSAGTGDILFMKGLKFPADVNGLVHKSPDKRYHADGKIMNRLVLKVDVRELS